MTPILLFYYRVISVSEHSSVFYVIPASTTIFDHLLLQVKLLLLIDWPKSGLESTLKFVLNSLFPVLSSWNVNVLFLSSLKNNLLNFDSLDSTKHPAFSTTSFNQNLLISPKSVVTWSSVDQTLAKPLLLLKSSSRTSPTTSKTLLLSLLITITSKNISSLMTLIPNLLYCLWWNVLPMLFLQESTWNMVPSMFSFILLSSRLHIRSLSSPMTLSYEKPFSLDSRSGLWVPSTHLSNFDLHCSMFFYFISAYWHHIKWMLTDCKISLENT